jgi:Holliday junction resolvasome RuvABC ATP-dependent DNA helicase subunit
MKTYSTMFKNLFRKFGNMQSVPPEEKLFQNIVGYPDLKRLFMKSVVSKQPVHILLTGPPASSKSLFLSHLLEELDNAYFMDAIGASGPGMMDYMFSNDIKYLLIDEIDKMKKNDQAALLNVMETGILSETKLKGKTRYKKMDLWIYATSNSVERLSTPLRSRFIELHLEEYNYEEFIEICRRLLGLKYHLPTELSDRIAYLVWNKMKSKDVRDVLKIGKLSNTMSDIEWLVDVIVKYRK